MTIPILLETRQYLVLDKPHGLNVERLPQGFPSVEGWVENYQLQAGVKKPYTGIVHRLDRPVSGALIVAKKKSALKELHEQFREHRVRKVYLAYVEGSPTKAAAELVHWLEKDQFNKRAIAHLRETKNAVKGILSYRILANFPAVSLLEIQPLTGKFHQIRAQLSQIGCPIVGDHKYGAKMPYHPEGIALHAHRITFTDPAEGQEVTVKAPKWTGIAGELSTLG